MARQTVSPDVVVTFQGQAQAYQSSFGNMTLLLVLSQLLTLYITPVVYIYLDQLSERWKPAKISTDMPVSSP